MLWRPRVSPRIEAALDEVRIFSTLAERDRRRLALMCVLEDFSAGDILLEEGSSGLGLLIIVSGRVEVFKTREGQPVQLAVLTRGAVVGEMALLDDRPRSASARALVATQCLVLSRSRFRSLLERRARIAWPIVPALVLRIRELQDQIVDTKPSTAVGDAYAAQTAIREPGSSEAEPPGDSDPEVAVAGEERAADPLPPDTESDSMSTERLSGGAATDLLRTQYAVLMTGVSGIEESARLIEVFLRSLDEETGMTEGGPVGPILQAFPAGLMTAGLRSWNAAMDVPGRMLASFRDHSHEVRSNAPHHDAESD